MKAVGIVVEYNPFHNGHLYHAEQARILTNSDIVIAVMSGSFLQRGEPAIVSKWQRTQMALAGGIDLVIELPYIYSTQKAEIFAKGAVSILTAMGADSINFGSESGDIQAFKQLVNTMNDHKTTFDQKVKDEMKLGVSYPRATAVAFKQLQLDSSVLALNEPNNILGYHYVKAVHEDGHQINATTTLRRQAHYHDEDVPVDSIASATSIRKALVSEGNLNELDHVMPATTYDLLQEYVSSYSLLHTWEHYFPLLQYRVLMSSPSELQMIYECEEGLEYRVIEMMKNSTSFHQWMTKMKTKRYTWTRLQRLATHILTNTTKVEIANELAHSVPYMRLLGMNEQGQAFLNQTKKQRQIPLLTKLTNDASSFATIEERVTNIYYAPFAPDLRMQMMKKEYKRTPIRHNKIT